MEIKEGMKFRCIKDVVMRSGKITYLKDDVYTSEDYGCITNKDGDESHKWINGDGSPMDIFSYYFEPIHEEPVKYDLEYTVVHCTTQEEFDRVLEWHISKKHLWKSGDLIETPCISKFECYGENSYLRLTDNLMYGDVRHLNRVDKVLSFSQFERDFLKEDKKREEPSISINSGEIKLIDDTEPSVKNDFKDGKLRWDLLPLDLIEELVKVYDYGAKKYYPESWKEIPDGYQRLKGAALRHLVAFEKGETNDPESGLPHLIQASWNLLSCYYYAKLKEKEE